MNYIYWKRFRLKECKSELRSLLHSFSVLRLGLAITFLWIGILILQEPAAWGSFIKPWVRSLIVFPLEPIVSSVGVLDVLIGFFLLINRLVRLASAIASIHLISILVISGIDSITVRDIGLLAGAIALFLETKQGVVH